jgi:hypothetical protein
MAATGFLPGVLSFLYALSRLERITHRSTNLPHSPALRGHTTKRKTNLAFSTGSTMAKWLRVTASGQRSNTQARSQAVDAHGFSRHNTGFFDSNRGETISFRIDQRLLVQYGYIHGFFSSEGVRGFSAELGSVVLLRTRTPSGSPLKRESEPPHGPPKLFYSHAPGSTLVALETACVPPARITFPWSGT